MKYINSALVIGILLILVPVLGFPILWKNTIMIILGVWLCGMSFSMRYYKPPAVTKPKKRVVKKHVSVDSISEVKNVLSVDSPIASSDESSSQNVSE